MKKVFVIFFTVFLSIFVIHCRVFSHENVTNNLIKLLDRKPQLKIALINSIAEAKKVNPNKQSNPAQSLEEFYDYIDLYINSIPGDILPGTLFLNNGKITRDAISQNVLYFFFLLNQPLSQLKNRGYFHNTLQYDPEFRQWLYELNQAKANFLNSKKSWSNELYKQFVNAEYFNFNKGWYGNKNIWQTFNQFFSRKIVPGARPTSDPNNNSIVVSPADSTPHGVWKIDNQSNINVKDGIHVKFNKYYNVKGLLKPDSKFKYAFKNGFFTHAYLRVNDYHRYHFPVSGKIVEKEIIRENISIDTYWDPVKKMYRLNNTLGWQFSQTRGYVIIETQQYGYVAVIPVGMENVSSIIFNPNVTIDSYHKKGDELGYFLFGGSDIIMLFQEKSHFQLADYITKSNGKFRHIMANQVYGEFKTK
ncbi:phosphatidylserine decarboxylase [Thiotrichales bacterium 19X7-9]|nr:phosphatidylserine decarboxylase [Thiotrichales bacterium 19X7-9]